MCALRLKQMILTPFKRTKDTDKNETIILTFSFGANGAGDASSAKTHGLESQNYGSDAQNLYCAQEGACKENHYEEENHFEEESHGKERYL